jgi:four helix bundle protein
MKNFKELRIWQKGFEIAVEVYNLVQTFPSTEKFGLSSQATRCAISIPSNVAEGSSRKSDKDYSRFIEIALGSCFELETQLLIAKAVNYGDKSLIDAVLVQLNEEEKMLSAFINTLKD